MWFTDAYNRLSKSQSNDTPAGQSHPPSGAPAKVASSKPNKSDNLIAFCTITSLLSKIQQESQMLDKDVQMDEIGLQKHMELKLLNALTTFLVMDHEVMAVIANHSYLKTVNILACTQSEGAWAYFGSCLSAGIHVEAPMFMKHHMTPPSPTSPKFAHQLFQMASCLMIGMHC